MRAYRYLRCSIPLLAVLAFSCKKKTEDFPAGPLTDYLSLKVGNYFIYRTDSTVFKAFGTVPEDHPYQEKQVVDAQTDDALGRPSYRIFRYLRDTSGTGPWMPAGTYFITPLGNSVEFIENNLRIVRMVQPLTQDNNWKAYRYLPDFPWGSVYNFTNDADIATWELTYSNVDGKDTINSKTYTNVLTIDGNDESFNANVAEPNAPGYVNYWQDKYAKGVGLIYQQFIMWEYQPPHENVPVGQKAGFGVKRVLIDHN